ncbi:hypothetical protein C5C95_11220 [Rathayibacter sp. AY1B7]|uniref:helix-turn-helix transcriptional regulator n=1 Tax=unclassified Rathayibacter TaxID=2609250 RepID=UPI000CE90F9B|nr:MULTISPECIES: helix-turn-helix transcriptional regulator [unclassified Rathayibacter]PPG38640.1 hypothetical protein C5C30_11725 [Rathayibacter sp. AY2B5]PPH97787.1 hypothetical protein C5C95_11220 [Rathayibacter sp. AY1B7]
MGSTLRIKPGLLKRLREVREIPSEEHQARLMGVHRATLRRVDEGAQPSAAFMVAMVDTFGLSIGEAFEVVKTPSLAEQKQKVAA